MTMSFQLNAIHNVNAVFFPLVAREVGLGLSEIGLTRGLYSLVNAVGRPLSSPLSGRFGAGRVALGGFILQAGIIAGVPFVAFGGLPAFLVMFALAGGGRAVAFTANAIQMAEEIPESRLSRGLSSSLFNAAKDLGNIAGPLIGSSLAAVVGLELMFVAAPALLLLLQLGVMLGFRSPPEVRATRATG